MKRILIFLYGIAVYTLSLGIFAYLAGFIANIAVPNSLDAPGNGHWATALTIDIGLILIFGLQHSVMARPAFKRIITSVIPQAAERTTYMLATNLVMILLFWQWRPLGGLVWNVQGEAGRVALTVIYALGWALVLLATFVINHFELFGLQQVWRNLFGTRTTDPKFKTPFLYRIVRHPLYVSWFIVFWSAPTMTVAHLVFALGLTTYILVAIQYEERDLIAVHPEYAEYRRQVPMLVPGISNTPEVPVADRTWNARS